MNDVETMARIINGEDTLPYSWSMLVSIRFNSPFGHECAGTILTESHILTSATCLQIRPDIKPSDVWIVTAIHFAGEKSPTVRQVDAFDLHPQWAGGLKQFTNDIAILHLSVPLNFSADPYIARTCVPPRKPLINVMDQPRNGTPLLVIGWGLKSLNPNAAFVQTMQQATIQAIHHEYPSCANSLHDPQVQFCAGLYEGGKGLFYISCH